MKADCGYKSCLFVNPTYIYDNVKYLEKITGKRAIPVIKSDSYGLGAVEIGKFLEENGYDFFAVASFDEAMELRESGIKSKILILSGTPDDPINDMIKTDIIPVLHSFEQYKSWKKTLKTPVRTHVKFNTGMNRLGFSPGEKLTEILNDGLINVTGFMTHYAKADSSRSFTEKQLKLFKKILKEYKINFDKYTLHVSNTASVINGYGVFGNHFRPGIFLYGGKPSVKFDDLPYQKLPYRWSGKIIAVRKLRKGDRISYGGTYIAKNNMKIGIIGVGYGDGLPRALSNKGFVLFKGKRLKIVGRVCMDMIMVDMTNLSYIKVGDYVTIMGYDNGDKISADDIATIAKTISYEVLTGITKRTKRIFSSNDKLNK